ncbi:hypothetical protein [Synechococcus sp. PCC 7336]|uniref:DUF6887 family protein n=1 Tax=Synechococcus sp. PCC 7336 TaxID=195250 RepID=UPI00034A6DEB|nr:hypothetical protein [Synechococcus sp. PCC 7336]
MSEVDLQMMSLKELKAYVLSHREDDQAFHTYMDRLQAEATWTSYPPLKSMEDMENYPEVIERFQQDSGQHS